MTDPEPSTPEMIFEAQQILDERLRRTMDLMRDLQAVTLRVGSDPEGARLVVTGMLAELRPPSGPRRA